MPMPPRALSEPTPAMQRNFSMQLPTKGTFGETQYPDEFNHERMDHSVYVTPSTEVVASPSSVSRSMTYDRYVSRFFIHHTS